MSEPFKILIVDDHPMFSYGTKAILEGMENILVVGIAVSGKMCLDLVAAHKPDLVLLDYNLPDQNGYELTKQIKCIHTEIQVVIFTGIDFMPMYNDLLMLNISGILAKNSSDEQLQNMIRCIIEGQTAIPLELFTQLRMHNMEASQGTLTSQEQQIMSMVYEGHTLEQIADTIFASKRTVDNYLRKIYGKLGAKNRAQALQKFMEIKPN